MAEPLHVISLIKHLFKGKCVDLGCADGRNLQLLPEGSVGVDIDISRVKRLEKKFKIVKHDLNKFPYPFKDNSFDTVLITHTLEHLNSPFLALKEVRRILKDSGVAIIAVPNPKCIYHDSATKPYHLYSFCYKDIKNLIKNSRFKIKMEYFNWPKTRNEFFGKVWNSILRNTFLKDLGPDFWFICTKK